MRTCACLVFVALIAVAGAACAAGGPAPSKVQTNGGVLTTQGRKDFVFKGKVDAVDRAAKTLTVTNENIDGWMPAMTMVYKADKDDVYAKVKAGDRITARVF